MKKVGPKIQVNLSDQDYDRVLSFSKQHNCSISEAARRMCHLGLEVWDDYTFLKIPQFAAFIDSVKASLKKERKIIRKKVAES